MMRDTIAYVVKGYPRLSESFIANEVRWLRRLGVSLDVFSIKHGEPANRDTALPEAEYLPSVGSVSACPMWRWLRENFAPFASSQGYLLMRHPLRYLHALGFAIASGRRYRGSGSWFKRSFVKEFLQASYIATRMLERGRYRHIHAHFCHGATTIAWMASMLTGLPFSFTAHAKDIYEKDLNPGDLLPRKLGAARFTVTCTKANVTYLSSLRPEHARVHAIYHGLDIGLFAPDPIAAPNPRPVRLISVGRFVEKKGFRYLVDACGLLRDRGIAFSLEIIGEPGDQSALIEQRISELELMDCIRISQAVPQTELAARYREADVFVLPCVVLESGDRDGIPNVMAEAMATGLPVVATNVSGIPELVDSNVNGLLVSQRSSVELAAALECLISDPKLRRRLGQAGRRRIERVFNAAETHRVLARTFDMEMARHATAQS